MRAPGVALLALCCVLTGCGERGPEWVRVDSGTTHTLEAIHGSGPEDVWAVGQAGTLLHFDGRSWSPMDSGTGENLNAVWAVGPKDAWAVGDGIVLHWDGSRWSRVSGSGGVGVWASGPGDVWVAAELARGILHFDGKTWSTLPLQDTYVSARFVWGSGPGDVWVSQSTQRDLMHGSSSGLGAVSPKLPSGSRCRDLSGTGPNEVWALYYVDYDDYSTDDEMVVLRKGAEGWSQVPVDGASRENANMWRALWGTGGKVWAVGMGGAVDSFDGSVWTEELRWDYEAPDLNDVWGSSEKDVWVVGENGLVARRAWPTSP